MFRAVALKRGYTAAMLRSLSVRIVCQMERDRAKLLQQTFAELNSAFAGQNRRAHSALPPLAVNRVKVTFRDEPGEGSGVARSFYTSVAEVRENLFHR